MIESNRPHQTRFLSAALQRLNAGWFVHRFTGALISVPLLVLLVAGPLIADRPARLASVLPPRLTYSGFLASNLQIFQGNFAVNCSFSRMCRCLRLSNRSQMPPFPVRLGMDEYLGGLKDRLPDLLKKVERFKAVFG